MDRNFEAYHGIGGIAPETTREVRERMHWLCSRIDGRRVLDVGCAQGIASILLARAGCRVDGIDTDAAAVKFAGEKLEAEPESIRGKVKFATGSFLTFDPGDDAGYEVVVLGGVLQDQVRPTDLIRRAFELLSEGGRLLVTVPFGIHDDGTHHQVFYLTSMYELLNPGFEIGEVRVGGGWVGFDCVRRAHEVKKMSGIAFETVQQLDEAFFAVERSLRDRILSGKSKLRLAADEKKKLEERLKTTAIAKNNAEKQLAEANRKLEGLPPEPEDPELAALRLQLEQEVRKSAGFREETDTLRTALQCASAGRRPEAEEKFRRECLQELHELREQAVARAERLGRLEGRVEALEIEKRVLTEASERTSAEIERSRELAEVQAEQLKQRDSEYRGLESRQATAMRKFKTEKARADAAETRLKKTAARLAEAEKALKEEHRLAGQLRAEGDRTASALKRSQAAKTTLDRQEAQRRAEIKELKEQLRQVRMSYDKLAKSKLGRLTLAYWRHKDRRKAK